MSIKSNVLAWAAVPFLATLGGAGLAQAQTAPTSPWYGTVNLGAGHTTESTGAAGLTASGLGGSVSQDNTRGVLGLSLGYQINPNFAIEGGYQNLGRYKYNAAVTSPTADSVSGRWRTDGWNLSAVGTLPINQDFSVYGKGGVFFSDTSFNGTGSTYALSQDKTRSVLTVGAGVAYKLSPQMDALVGWDRYQHLGDATSTGRTNLDTVTVGLKYRF